MTRQQRLAWMTVLAVLGYEGLGGMVGGALLVVKPDGHYMNMPVGLMHGTFQNFLIPGLLLLGLSLFSLFSFMFVLRNHRMGSIWSTLAMVGWTVWFFVEIMILRELHWLHAMWGLPVVLGVVAAVSSLPLSQKTKRNGYLLCGVISSLLYMAMNILIAREWPDYNSASQTVSELSAVGAPTRPIWVVTGLLYSMLVIAFGWGVQMSAANNRQVRIAGLLIVVYGGLGLVWPFAPMHLRPELAAGGSDYKDTLHLILGGITVILYFAILGLVSGVLGKTFRIFSTASLAGLLVFAALTFRDAPRVAANQPTPLLGIWERIDIGIFLAWVIVLSGVLLARNASRLRRSHETPGFPTGSVAA